MKSDTLLTVEEVCAIAKISKPTIYRRVKKGTFPPPMKVPSTANRGPKLVNRWSLSEIESHYSDKLQRRDDSKAEEALPEPWYVVHRHVLTAVVGGVLAAAAYAAFR